MALKILNIWKANDEIDRLTAEVARISAELVTAQAAVTAGATSAEDVKKITDGHAEAITTLNAEHATALAAKQAEITNLQAAHVTALAAKDAEIKTAQTKAVAQLAKAGHTPVAAEPGVDGGKPVGGAAKSREDVMAEYNAITDPKAKADFYRANEKLMFAR